MEAPPKPLMSFQRTPTFPWGQLSESLVLAAEQYYLVLFNIAMTTLYYF